MTRLSRLLRVLGADELARRLGRSSSTVRRWARSGTPRAAREELRAVEVRRDAARRAAKRRATARSKRERAVAEKRKAAQAEERARKERAERERREAERARKEAERKRLVRIQEAAKRKREQQAAARKRAVEESQKKARAEQARKEREARELERKTQAAEKDVVEKRRQDLADARKLLNDSNRAIAEAIGVDEGTVRRWMKKPPPGKSVPFEKLRHMLDTIRTFLELMKMAGEVGAMPVIRPGHGDRSGRKTEGVYWTRAVYRALTSETVEAMAAWVRGHSGNYPYWQAVAVTSQYSLSSADFDTMGPKETDRSYKTIIMQLGGTDEVNKNWGNFAVERMEPSAETRSPGACARDFSARLMRRVESDDVQVFVHGVTLFAYRRRSEQEQRSWATSERKQRKERWERRKVREKERSKSSKASPERRRR